MTVVRHRPHRSLSIVALASLLLSTAACGARWNDEQRAEIHARHSGAQTAAAGAGGTATTAAPGGAGPGATTASGTGAGSGSAAGATGGQAADGSGAAATGGGGSLPCAAPSDAPGVTDGEITVGAISSLTGPAPGIGASAGNAARAYVEYRNANGGVCGRQIVLREADDGTDVGRYRSVIGQLEPQVLGIAGGFAIGDIGAADVVQQAGLPMVNSPSGDAMSVVPSVFDINPPFESTDAVIGKYRYLYEQGARTVAMAYIAVDQSRAEANLQRSLMEAAGLQIVQVQELPLSTLSYDSAARGVANSGADYLFFISHANGNVSMARSMADTGHPLRFAEYYTFAYGTDFISAAGAASEGATTWLRTLPNEEAGANAEMATFLEWMDQVASDDVRDVFAADSWASAKAFFEALEALPGPISREALVAQLASIETYDAGGMLGPIRLGAELTNGCLIGMRVESGQWRRMAPADGFLCT